MAHLILAIVVALALAASPVTASAARMACGMEARPGVASSMTSMDGASADRHAAPTKSLPCCDQAMNGCAQTCSMACGAAIVGATAASSLTILGTGDLCGLPQIRSARSHNPPGPDHPPKPTA